MRTALELCEQQKIELSLLALKTGLEESRVQAILLRRWTPSPAERQKIAGVLGTSPEEIVWGHATPIQHLYGSGPG